MDGVPVIFNMCSPQASFRFTFITGTTEGIGKEYARESFRRCNTSKKIKWREGAGAGAGYISLHCMPENFEEVSHDLWI
ncbi:GL22859 [Drosophila persimilis]|uniref:GL22859 n=1 Tax=Drosophila persimilis TaxID=7234 RepID=B4GZT9_DROPE|nr:GL22859 [Drosophila persimilis]